MQASTTDGGGTWTWGFALHQYDRIGNSSGNTSINGKGSLSVPSGTVDLFGNSTSTTSFGIYNSTTAGDYSGEFVDWGNINIGGYGKNYWRTLTEAEWQYVVGEDTYRHTGGTITIVDGSSTTVVLNSLCTKAHINGVSRDGFILFPDHYSGSTPSGVIWQANAISPGGMVNSDTDGWGATLTGTAAWDALEAEGCVFLPVSGLRQGSGVYNTTQGYYRMSDKNNYVLRFNDDGFDPNQTDFEGRFPFWGIAVRLVHEID